jgi:DNA-binding NarL/FixJ family response regulator
MSLGLLLADERTILRKGLRALLEAEGFAILGEASSSAEAVGLARDLDPAIVILDPPRPLPCGLELAREMSRVAPSTKLILLTENTNGLYVLECLRAGIRGYVLKTQSVADLSHALREVGRGVIYVSPAIAGIVLEASVARTATQRDPLTSREREVLQLVAEGKTTKQAAQVLGVSAKTADTHRTHAMRKLGVHDTAGLVRYAIRQGLIEA